MQGGEAIGGGNALVFRSMLAYCLMTVSFALIYFTYTLLVDDDLGLRREGGVDTLVNCAFIAAFVSAGSLPPGVTHISSLSRIVLLTHAVLAGLLKVWTITTD